jgi:hypothetical protein
MRRATRKEYVATFPDRVPTDRKYSNGVGGIGVGERGANQFAQFYILLNLLKSSAELVSHYAVNY